MFFISYWTRTGPCGTRSGAERYSYGHIRELTQSEFAKIPHGRRMWPYGPLVVPHGLFMGCLWYLHPYGAYKLIMHALKLYGPCTGRQNSYGATRVSYEPREWTYDFLFKTAQEQHVRGPVWCDLGITQNKWNIQMQSPWKKVKRSVYISYTIGPCIFAFWKMKRENDR